MTLRQLCGALFLLMAQGAHPAEINWDAQFSVSPQYRLFFEPPAHPDQTGSGTAVAFQAKLRGKWNGGQDSLELIPYYRWDQQDAERRYFDWREASWSHYGDGWASVLGISKVFWGVTESQHLVDVINQTDLAGSPTAEAKLGQPMLRLSRFFEADSVEIFLLPQFRERRFPGPAGRLRSDPPVLSHDARVDRPGSGLDLALRGTRNLGALDVGLSYFNGTSREAQFEEVTDVDGNPGLRPVYPRIQQLGLETQATLGAWLWKLEAVRRYAGAGANDSHAAVGGFEYTRFGLFDSVADLGLLAEYNYDSRGRATVNGLGNDLFLGLRWLANDTADSNALLGLMVGLDGDGNMLTLEGGQRLDANMRLNIEARRMLRANAQDALYSLRADSYLQVELEVFF